MRRQLQGPRREAERRLAQSRAELRDSEERLRAIVTTAVEGIVTISERGVIESFNPAAELMFGYREAELIGQNVSVLMPTPYREAHDGYLANYLRTGQAKIIGIGREVVGQRKDGSVFPMDLSVSEVQLVGGRKFTGILRDITERKRLEQEILQISEQEQRRIGQDLHDGICQQLAGIELMSEVLEQALGRKSKKLSAQAAQIAANVREVISQTRLLAHGLCPVVLEDEGLMAALHELAFGTRKMFGVDCAFHCDPPLHVADIGIASHLYRIAQEAVSNALRHGQARQIAIQLTHTPEELRLIVTDNGQGLPAARPKRSGLGLRAMQYRAGMMNATVSLRPNEPTGVIVLCAVRQPPDKPLVRSLA